MANVYLTIRGSKTTLTHKWKTNIQTTLKGSERRAALFSWPRKKISLGVPTGIHKAQGWLKHELYHHVDDIWGIPVWPDLSKITSTASGTSLPCDTTNRHFEVDRECLIVNKYIDSWNDYEVHTIDSISDNSITLSGSLSKSWSSENYVVPLYDIRLKDASLKIQRQIQEYEKFTIEGWQVFESTQPDYVAPASGTITYRDKEVFIYQPNSPKDESWSRPVNYQQDLGIGFKHCYYSQTPRKYEQEFLLGSKSDIQDILDFFDRHKGRFKSFWFPTWNKDIKPSAPIAADDVIITIEDIDYDTEWLPNEVIGKRLYIQLPDKSYVLRRITNATSGTVILDEAIGTAVSAANLYKMHVSFLEMGRFDIDEIDVDYVVGKENIAYIKLYLHGLVEEEDDYLPPPVSVTAYPATGSDDGYWYGAAWNNNYGDLLLGNYNGSAGYVFVRFQNVEVPQGASITEAYIKFTSYNNQSGTALTKIFFNDVDNATAPANKTEQQAKVKTTNWKSWEITTAWNNDSQYDTIDISDIVQEIVDRGGWSSGNAMMALIEDDSSAWGVRRQASSYDYASASEKAELHITYSQE